MIRKSRIKYQVSCKCGWTGNISQETINNNIKKNGEYTCHKCSTIKAGAAGKYSGTFTTRSETSKSLWENQEYKDKITQASIKANTTQDYKLAQSIRTKSCWLSEQYRQNISDKITKIMADPAIKSNISAKLRAKWTDEQYRNIIIANLGRQKISSLQIKLYEYLDDLNVSYHKEGKETIIGHYSFDCLIPHQPRSILIECQGNYWHSLPKSIRNDKSKFTYINKYFPEYEIMYIWEHEFHTKDRVLDRLKLKLGKTLETINFEFSDLKFNNISRQLSNNFLSNYHYLTSSNGGKDHGLWLDETLIAVARFSPLSRQNIAHQFKPGAVELSRLCVHPSYHKKNLLSWWLSKLVKLYSAVVSYADTTVGHTGAVYKASNFKLHHTVNPDYWYVDVDGYVMHKKTLYNRAVNLKLTESEYATQYSYSKKYGGHKLCFVYER